MTKQWRLIVDGRRDGFYNMACDEALFRAYRTGQPVLRIYGWRVPFISLGYNQAVKQVVKNNSGISFVRRLTGGAAILHDKELTYSLVCSRGDLDLPPGVKNSYRVLCSFLLKFYRGLGLNAGFAGDMLYAGGQFPANRGNFCFSGLEHFDIVIDGRKIGGNAQRRGREVIFQHGSVPLELNAAVVKKAIIKTGDFSLSVSLNQLTSGRGGFFALRERMALSFKDTFKVDFVKNGLGLGEKRLCAGFLRGKYMTRDWNVRRLDGYSLV